MKCVGNIATNIDGPINREDVRVFSTPSEGPKCSFSGKPAKFYIGLGGSNLSDEIRIIGAISLEYVETAIVNVMGQGVDDIQWPVILDLNKEIYYHSYHAHINGYSAIIGWKNFNEWMHCQK